MCPFLARRVLISHRFEFRLLVAVRQFSAGASVASLGKGVDLMLSTVRRVGSVRLHVCACILFLATIAPGVASAQFLMMPDSTNNRLVLFDPFDGSLVDSNYFALASGTPVEAIQSGTEIWISEQLGDRVSRWSLTGTPLGQFGGGATGGLDNVRGIDVINNVLHVSNAGSGNSAQGASLVQFDSAGTNLGFLAMTNSPGPFDVIDYQGGLLVSSSSANDDIHRYTYAGASVGTFYNNSALNFVEQLRLASNGDVLAAGFSSNNVARLDAAGTIVSSFAASGTRGVWELGNGNIMWTNGSGAHVFDVATGGSTQVYSGGGRFLGSLVIPEPCCGVWGLVVLGAVCASRPPELDLISGTDADRPMLVTVNRGAGGRQPAAARILPWRVATPSL